MYQLKETQKTSLLKFISSLDGSIVKSKMEKWANDLDESGIITSEQMQAFVSFANNLPKGAQNFPQEFAMAVKNGVEPDIASNPKKVKEVTVKAPVKKK